MYTILIKRKKADEDEESKNTEYVFETDTEEADVDMKYDEGVAHLVAMGFDACGASAALFVGKGNLELLALQADHSRAHALCVSRYRKGPLSFF